SGDEVRQLPDQARLRHRSDQRLDNLAALVDMHRRDADDAVTAGHPGVLVGVELDDLDLVGVLGGQLFEHRRDRAARTAPRRPEVHEDWLVVVEDVGLEGGVGDFLGGSHVMGLLSLGRGCLARGRSGQGTMSMVGLVISYRRVMPHPGCQPAPTTERSAISLVSAWSDASIAASW